MRDDFESIRAERDAPAYRQAEPRGYPGLWQQIALGIVVGYSALGILGTIGWLLLSKLALGSLQIDLP